MAERLLPMFLKPNQRTLECMTSVGLNGVCKESTLNRSDIGDSVHRFCWELSSNGRLAELITLESRNVDPSGFSLLGGRNNKNPPVHPEEHYFYQDAPYSMILINSKLDVAWCCGFDFYSEKEWFRGRNRMNFDDVDPGSVIIFQLQGRTYDKVGLNSVPSLRWECILVECVACWAQSNFHRTIYMQPGENNDYYKRRNSSDELNARLVKRYNETARQLGFKINGPGRLHSLDLQWFDPALRPVK